METVIGVLVVAVFIAGIIRYKNKKTKIDAAPPSSGPRPDLPRPDLPPEDYPKRDSDFDLR